MRRPSLLTAALMLALPVALAALLTWLHFWLRKHYLHNLVRIFLEKPLFVIPRGQPTADAEEVGEDQAA